MTPALEIAQLTKDFPLQPGRTRLRAVDDLSLRVAPGEVRGLLGPNGSGKSTTLKILLGLLAPTAGTCRIFGVPCAEPRARGRVGFLAESAQFPGFLTARELTVHAGRLCGMNRADAAARADAWLRWAGLADAADRRLATFSHGMRQRAGLAQALVHDPDLVILDEPTTGLDPLGVAEFGALVRDLKARGKTVLLCTHHLAQAEELCDRVAILRRGRLVADEAVADFGGPRRPEASPTVGALERGFLELVQEHCPSGAVLRVSDGMTRAETVAERTRGETGIASLAVGRAESDSVPARARGPIPESIVICRASGGMFSRLGLIAAQTLRESLRQRTPYVVLLLALSLVAGAQVLRGFAFGGGELKFLGELGLGVVSLAGSVLAVASATQLFAGDLDRGAALWVLSKPVRRAEFVVGKFLGVWAALAGFVGVLVALVGGQLAARAFELGVPAGPLVVPLATAAGSLALKLGVVAALTLLLGSWVRTPLLALVAALLAVAACHLQPFAEHAWAHSASAVVRAGASALALALPNLAAFEPELANTAAGAFASLAGYALAYVTVLTGLACVVFRRREL